MNNSLNRPAETPPASMNTNNQTETIVKEHWWGLILTGLGLGPLSLIVTLILYPLLSLTTAAILGILFKGAAPYMIISVPFVCTAGLVAILLNYWEIVNPKTIAFSVISITWGGGYLANTLADKILGADTGMPAAIIAILVLGQTLPILVALRERYWFFSLGQKSIASIGIVFGCAAIATSIVI